MLKFLVKFISLSFLVTPFQVKASYAAQTLKQQTESADQVMRVQIVSGKAHQYTHVYRNPSKPENSVTDFRTCGFSYVARVKEPFKGELKELSLIEFSSINSFSVGSELLLFLSENKRVMATDVMSKSKDESYNLKVTKCMQELPRLYSMHLSTTEIMYYNWVGVTNYDALPEELYQSPFLIPKPQNSEERLGWDKGPDEARAYGSYSKWDEFRQYLLKVLEKP